MASTGGYAAKLQRNWRASSSVAAGENVAVIMRLAKDARVLGTAAFSVFWSMALLSMSIHGLASPTWSGASSSKIGSSA
jgi:hypothetical protein